MGMFDFVGDLWNDITGASQMQANSQDFSREMAQFARENAKNRYQWAVEDMQKAGLNPAMMYSNGGSWAGSPASVPSAGSTVGGGTAAMGSLLGFLGNLAYGQASGTFDKLRAETEATQLTSASSARQMNAQADRAAAEASLAREDARVYAQLPDQFRNFLGMMRLAPGGSASQLVSLGMEALNAAGKKTLETVDKHFGQTNAQDVSSAKSFKRRRDAVVPATEYVIPKSRADYARRVRESHEKWKRETEEKVGGFFERVGRWMTGVSEKREEEIKKRKAKK